LTLLLAGPALSLPSIAVIDSVGGFRKTFVFVSLTIVMSAVVGKITNINVITGFGVMMTPALAVDGEVKLVGRVATPEEIQKSLT
jgi:hypothetical protein